MTEHSALKRFLRALCRSTLKTLTTILAASVPGLIAALADEAASAFSPAFGFRLTVLGLMTAVLVLASALQSLLSEKTKKTRRSQRRLRKRKSGTNGRTEAARR